VSRPAPVRRALAAAVLAPLALTSLVACGGDDKAGSASDPASSASSSTPATSEASDAPAEGETVAPAAFLKSYADGFADSSAHVTMAVTVSGQSIQGEGDVDYSTGQPSMSMTMDTGGQTLDVRLLDGIMYLKMGQLTGGKYVKMDLSDPNSPLGSLGGQLDPKSALASLGPAVEKVVYQGEDSDGKKYRMTVNMRKVMRSQGQRLPSSSGVPKTIDYDIWLDDENRFTKMSGDLGALGTMEMTASDWGKDVSVEAPPAGQVTSAPGLGAGAPSA
jgi:6-phosphofructokinase